MEQSWNRYHNCAYSTIPSSILWWRSRININIFNNFVIFPWWLSWNNTIFHPLSWNNMRFRPLSVTTVLSKYVIAYLAIFFPSCLSVLRKIIEENFLIPIIILSYISENFKRMLVYCFSVNIPTFKSQKHTERQKKSLKMIDRLNKVNKSFTCVVLVYETPEIFLQILTTTSSFLVN